MPCPAREELESIVYRSPSRWIVYGQADLPCGSTVLGRLAEEEADFFEGLCESIFGRHGRLCSQGALEQPRVSSMGRKARWVKLGEVRNWMARRCEVESMMTKVESWDTQWFAVYRVPRTVTYRHGTVQIWYPGRPGAYLSSAGPASICQRSNQIFPSLCQFSCIGLRTWSAIASSASLVRFSTPSELKHWTSSCLSHLRALSPRQQAFYSPAYPVASSSTISPPEKSRHILF